MILHVTSTCIYIQSRKNTIYLNCLSKRASKKLDATYLKHHEQRVICLKVIFSIHHVKKKVHMQNVMFIQSHINVMFIQSHINVMFIQSHINVMFIQSHINVMFIQSHINVMFIQSHINVMIIQSHINVMIIQSHINVMTIICIVKLKS